jgi:hypothetical protein
MSLNRYTYAYASPLDYWDPDGQLSIEAANSYDNYTTRPRPAAARPAGTADSIERRLTTPRRATTATARADEASVVRRHRTAAPTSPATSVRRPEAEGSGFWSEAARQTGGFFRGFGSHVLGTIGEIRDLAVWNYRSGPINAVLNPESYRAQTAQNVDLVGAVARNPGMLWQSIVADPFNQIVDPWREGNQGETIGQATAAAAEVLIGARLLKSLTATRPATLLDDGARAVDEARGGVYSLRNEAGDVVRTGRSSDLAAREAALFNDPVLGEYRFSVEYRTDLYAEQRGLEQMLYDRYPGAQATNGGFNMIRGISPSNPNLPSYMQAAQDFLESLGS